MDLYFDIIFDPPSLDIDSSFPAIYNEESFAGNNYPVATTTMSHNTIYKLDDMSTNRVFPCLSLNNLLFDSTCCQSNQINLVLSTLLSLHETLFLSLITFCGTIHLIVQSLFLILSLAGINLSYDAYFISGKCVIV